LSVSVTWKTYDVRTVALPARGVLVPLEGGSAEEGVVVRDERRPHAERVGQHQVLEDLWELYCIEMWN
jgi:hypothetical protein